MHVVAQGESAPGEILSALLAITGEQTTAVRIAVAYTTFGGCNLLIPQLAVRVGRARWEGMPKTFVTSLDFGLTEPEALGYLLRLPRATVRVAGAELLDWRSFQPARAYHPKLYAFDHGPSLGLLTGSANLTERGLTVNTEAATVHGSVPVADLAPAWDVLLAATRVLDAALLERYRAARRDVPAPPPPEVPVQPRPVPLQGLRVFGEAIAEGRIRPEQFSRFWVEAGSMSSGGSNTQLEMPRGAHRFFGFRFTEYDDNHRTLGHPALAVGGRRWTDRPLTWHGNNKMERLNLPSAAQGSYDAYAGTAILFRRSGATFELEVASWDSPLAASWRNASSARGLTFKLGERSPRTCGVL